MAGYDGHRGWLYTVAVSPGHRRRGVGTALVRPRRRRAAPGGLHQGQPPDSIHQPRRPRVLRIPRLRGRGPPEHGDAYPLSRPSPRRWTTSGNRTLRVLIPTLQSRAGILLLRWARPPDRVRDPVVGRTSRRDGLAAARTAPQLPRHLSSPRAGCPHAGGIVRPETAARVLRAAPWERGRPARKRVTGPPVLQRAERPRSQETRILPA